MVQSNWIDGVLPLSDFSDPTLFFANLRTVQLPLGVELIDEAHDTGLFVPA
jgi:hypothetical protein